MKILYFNPEAALGGAERCLEELAVGIRARKDLKPHVLLLAPGPLADRLQDAGIPVEIFPLPSFWAELGESGAGGRTSGKLAVVRHAFGLWRWSRNLKRRITEIAPDVIHSNGIKTHLLTGLIGWRGPVVWQIHDFLDSRRLSRFLLRYFSRRVSVAVANSSATLEHALTVLRCPLVRLYNGVPFPSRRKSPAPPKRGKNVRLSLVATYARWKGHDLFLEAIACLADEQRLDGMEFTVCGGAIYRSAGSQWNQEDLDYEARRLGIEKHVEFRPFEANLDRLYEDTDIVVNASLNPEPFGRTVAEAMARGKAVILPHHGGVAEVARDGKEAVHFPPGDAKELAEAMYRLAHDEPLRERLAAAAKLRADDTFSLEECVARWSEIYVSVMGQPSRPRVLVAMGFAEDGWHSMTNTSLGLFRTLEEMRGVQWQPEFYSPSLGRYPRVVDRRGRYPRWLPPRDLLLLTDHSYADTILKVRDKYKKTAVIVHDFYFWRTRHAMNARVRQKIMDGIRAADVRIAVSDAVRVEAESMGIPIEEVILSGTQPAELPRFTAIERIPGCLVHIGGTGPRKGMEKLLRLLERLPASFFLVQVGPALTSEQHRLIREKRLTSRVRETGPQTNQELAQWYHRAHAVVIPSSYEGFSLPAVEARRAGARVFLSPETPAWDTLKEDPGTIALPFAKLDGTGKPAEKEFLDRATAAVVNSPCDSIPFALDSYFDWSRAGEEYGDVIDQLLGVKAAAIASQNRKRRA